MAVKVDLWQCYNSAPCLLPFALTQSGKLWGLWIEDLIGINALYFLPINSPAGDGMLAVRGVVL